RMMKVGLVKTCSLIAGFAAACLGQPPDFIQPAAYPTGGDSTYVVSADFNRDGNPDIVTCESASMSLSILFGAPDHTFQPAASRVLAFAPASLAAADLNGDGAADLIVTTGGQVAVLLNDGNGSFAPPAFYLSGVSANYVTAKDLNGDGAMDLVVAGTSGLAVFRGLGNGAFAAPLVLPTALSHFWVGVADFNGDGYLDLVADGSPGAFYAGNGNGAFAAPVSTVAVPSNAVVGDFNADGKMDIACLVNTINQERISGQQTSIMIGMGDGSFLDAIRTFFSGSGSGQLAAGDFNGDGHTDLGIWLADSSRLYLITDGTSIPRGVPVDLSASVGATMTAADVDGNGSADFLLLNKSVVTLLRNTHGNPPLLALAALDRASVTGGAQAQGAVTLGGPAPDGGATVVLASDNPGVAYPVLPAITIPAGASTATFSVSSSAVSNSSPVTITGAYNGVVQGVTLTVVSPYALTGVGINPARQFGGFTTQASVTLSGPADSNATVYLSSSNPAVASVPATVQVPAGATEVPFPVACQPVAADTPVVISASMGGLAFNAGVTVLRPLDNVHLTRAEYTLRSAQLRIEATSTNTTATLSVWNASTGALIGTLSPAGGGKYTGTFTVSSAVLSATIRSSLGGTATGTVSQK
ncbi:MAG TPA: VCBS repeat-containing protein, partial [Bryobacteraceae bacterium]|nr:VCBS repeat-containing protein [Bryobacteraceae bacterium]